MNKKTILIDCRAQARQAALTIIAIRKERSGK